MTRMRHTDPNVRISVGARQDDGAYLIPDDRLDDAMAHGFYVCHTDSDRQTETEAERGGEPVIITVQPTPLDPEAKTIPTTEEKAPPPPVPAAPPVDPEEERIMAELKAEEAAKQAAPAETPPEPAAEAAKPVRRRPAQ